jgi:hypothetical protein
VKTIDLPGGSATIYDPDEVPERVRRALEKGLQQVLALPAGAVLGVAELAKAGDEIPPELVERAEKATVDDLDVLYEFKDQMILALVTKWTYGEVTNEVLLDLPGRKAYDQIYEALPTLQDLRRDTEVSPEDDSPTLPSEV